MGTIIQDLASLARKKFGFITKNTRALILQAIDHIAFCDEELAHHKRMQAHFRKERDGAQEHVDAVVHANNELAEEVSDLRKQTELDRETINFLRQEKENLEAFYAQAMKVWQDWNRSHGLHRQENIAHMLEWFIQQHERVRVLEEMLRDTKEELSRTTTSLETVRRSYQRQTEDAEMGRAAIAHLNRVRDVLNEEAA